MVRARWIADRLFGSRSRPIRAHEQGELAALLAHEPGYSLFLSSNLDLFGLRHDSVRFWGVFTRGRLNGVAMMVEHRATLYAPPEGDIQALARLTIGLRPEFVMGRADLVDAVTHEHSAFGVTQREDHVFATLARHNFNGDIKLEADAIVRRAGRADTPALARLFAGSDGFEQRTDDQVASVMSGRISNLRTYAALVGAEAVAGASTSAETRACAMVGGVWTAPAWRNRGFSTAVVTALSAELLHEGRVPYLFYRHDNAPAARVYARVGYRPIGRWTVVYSDRRDSSRPGA